MFGQRSLDPQPGTHYRSSRVSAVNGQYFFATREGTLEGPYLSRHDAVRLTVKVFLTFSQYPLH